MATRFYLSSSTLAHREPGFAGWTRTTEGERRRMSPQKDGSTIQSTTFWANGATAADETALARQFVSDPMAAGIAFVTTDTIKCQVLCRESAVNDNINRQPITVKVYSEDGQTLRATMLALAHVGPNTTEWLNTGPRNKIVADSDTLTTGYTTVAGDRLVIELGGQASSAGGTTVTGTQWYGADGASDLGENETDTDTALNPWFEISRTITFLDPDFTTQQNQFPDIKPPTTPPIAVGLMVAAGLLLTTLAPTPAVTRSPYYAGRQALPIVQQVDAPQNLLPLLLGGEAAPTPFAQYDWPIPNPLPLLPRADVYQPLAQFSLRPYDGCPAGPYFATTVVNDASVGDVAWVDPGNAVVSDDQYATATLVAQTSQWLKATGFNFNIAPTKFIAGIKVEIEITTTNPATLSARIVKAGTIGATSRAFVSFTEAFQQAGGGEFELWDDTWTPADINDPNFGVAIRESGVSTETYSVDSFRITVYCHDPLPLNPPTNLVVQQAKAAIQSDLPPNLLTTTLAPAEQAPFSQLDWPNPLAALPAARQQDQQVFLNLLLAPTGDKPFLQSDWSQLGPQVAPFIDYLPNLLETTLAPAPGEKPFSLTDWPQLKPQAPLSTEQPPSLLETTLAPAPGEKPFSQSDWPNPLAILSSKAPQHSSYRLSFGPPEAPTTLPFNQKDWPRLTALPDLYQEFSYLNLALGTMPFRQSEWPLHPPVSTFLQPVVGPNLIKTLLGAEDQFPFVPIDWPLPKIIIQLRTFDAPNVTINLPIGAAPFIPLEWPVLKPTQPLPVFDHLNLTIQLPTGQAPFAQLQWSQLWITEPVRQGDAPNLVLTTLATTAAAPFSQTDWPLPKPLARLAQDHGRSQPLPILVEAHIPFRQSIWNLPAVQTLFGPTVTEQRLLTLAPAPGPMPFSQIDWPLVPPTDKSKLNMFMLTENVVLLTTPPPPVATGTRKKRKWRRSST